MTKSALLSERDTVQKLENKILELEKANLRLQEYFAKISESNNHECLTPFSGKHTFKCSLKFTIDLELNKVVWVNTKKNNFQFKHEKFFLMDIEPLSNKLFAQIDRRRFLDLINKSREEEGFYIQTLFRTNHQNKNFEWGLAIFEKTSYILPNEQYLQVEIVKLEETSDLADLLGEFTKKIEKTDHYQKIESLTERQREILGFLGKGLTSKEIADKLSISFHTVEAHRKIIARKTQTKKRAALICLAAEVGILK